MSYDSILYCLFLNIFIILEYIKYTTIIHFILCLYKRTKFRSSHWMCSVRKGVLRNFAKFTGKHLCLGLVFNKVSGLRPATFLLVIRLLVLVEHFARSLETLLTTAGTSFTLLSLNKNSF